MKPGRVQLTSEMYRAGDRGVAVRAFLPAVQIISALSVGGSSVQ